MKKQEIAVTVDNVVLCEIDNKYKVLLIQRKNDPFKNQWALPGGFVEETENLESAARRELKEETGLTLKTMQQIGAFGEPDRDPRMRTISIAFLSKIKEEIKPRAADDASDAKWVSFKDLSELELAFDHAKIISVARQYL